jgi:predicted dehydrogenase
VRFIHVGVGGYGGSWCNTLAKERRAKVVAMVDVSKKALQEQCAKHGYDEGICYSSLDKALKSVEADALVCVTPPAMHREHVVAGLRAGLNVISEKPMAESMTDCKAMLREARKTGQTYVVSQNYRFSPDTYTMAQMIKKGVIGEIGQVKIDYYMGVDKDGFRAQMDFPLLVDMSIHHFDLIRYLTGLSPVSVKGEAWNPSWSHFAGDASSSVVFEMSNGARVLYNASWCAKGDRDNWTGSWQIEGTKGRIEYDHGVVTLHRSPKGYKVVSSKEVPLRKMRRQRQPYVLDNFIKSVASGDRPLTDAQDNIESVAMVFAAVKAVKTGQKVKVIDSGLKKLMESK